MRKFAYTFAYTPIQTTLRAPVYMALPWVSALIILWSQVQVLVGPPATEPLAFIAPVAFLLGCQYIINFYQGSFSPE